jgi:hypothetical protein
MSPLRRLDSTLLRDDDLVGAVATLGGSTRRAEASRSLSRSRASARLRAWDLSSSATTLTSGPRRSSRRALWRGPRTRDPSMSKRTSARVLAVLACWPPGPELRLKRHASSLAGIDKLRDTRRAPRSSVRGGGSDGDEGIYRAGRVGHVVHVDQYLVKRPRSLRRPGSRESRPSRL